MRVCVLHTAPITDAVGRIYGVAAGEHAFERLNMEMANYSEAEQAIMTITDYETLE